MQTLAGFLANLVIGYAFAGVFFAIYFVSVGAARLDAGAARAPLGFRLLIFPGAAALWPLLLGRLLRGQNHPPEERNAHRKLAKHS